MRAKQIVFLVLIVAVVGALVFFASRGTTYTLKEKTDTYEVAIRVPVTNNEALNDALQSYADFLSAEFSELYGREMFSDEEYELLGFADGRRYELIVGGTSWSHGPLSGALLERYTYTGGAHGATDYIQFAFDEEGTPIGLDALFVPQSQYLERIANAVRPELQKKLEAKDAYLPNMFDVGTKADPGNYMVFTLGDNGITFVFQEYQVAPYAAGSERVTVPLDVFEDILNPSYF